MTVTTVPGINQAFNTCQALDGASQVALVVKNLPTDAGELRDAGSFPGSQSQVNDFYLLLLLLLSRFSRVRLCATPQTAAVPGILQARTLEWVAISFSNA